MFHPLRTLAILAAGLAACGGPVASARSEFDQGHYAAAKQALVNLGGRPRRVWTVPDRAAYALYCGLTYGALGDVGRASLWLREARGLQDRHPGALEAEDDERLRAALQTYEVGP